MTRTSESNTHPKRPNLRRPGRVVEPDIAPPRGSPPEGRSFEIDQVVFVHFRDGLIVEAWEIADTGSLLRQLGVA